MKTEYKIATEAQGVGGLTYVEALGSVTLPSAPKGLAVEQFSVYRTSASGREYGDGYPRCEWFFSAIPQAQLTALLGYLGGASNQSAVVYIKTRKSDRLYANYKAVMHRPKPDEMSSGYSSMWHDVTIRFTMLEAQ